MRIGIDFGSTYSTVAIYNEDTDNAEAVSPAEGEPVSIPSVVSYKQSSNTYLYGSAAKNMVGKKCRIFEAFKMLIATQDKEMLRRRGYDDKFTPSFISSLYLEHLIKSTLKRFSTKSDIKDIVEELVICVPEVWGRDPLTQDGRPILLDILQNRINTKIEKVRTVTEPEAASAYFAYNYEKKTGKAFNGHLLLIDYGGGTLDITLTEVTSDGRGNMEICYKDGGGEGENHPKHGTNGVIGCAGIAYMQNVVLRAIKNNIQGFNENDIDYSDAAFASAVCELENVLKSTFSDQIEDYFSEFGNYGAMSKVMNREKENFTTIEYDGEDITVSYQDLYASYKEVIDPILQRQIDEINKKVLTCIKKDPCDPRSGEGGDFIIAIVGGFSSFYLLKQQLSYIYNLDPEAGMDPRTKQLEAGSREQAIALGAALIADHKVDLKKTARFSFGIAKKEIDRNTGKWKYTKLYYAIKCHQVFEPGVPYFICYENGERVSFGSLSGNINEFVIEYTERLTHGRPMKCKDEILDKLRELPVHGFWYCGFSMDNDDMITFHVVPDENMDEQYKEIRIPLDSYQRLFDFSEAKEVVV